MIVRILGEGQFDVADDALGGLNRIDEQLVAAIERGDDDAFADLLTALLDETHRVGTALPAEYLGPSELILPGRHATRTEVEALLADDGLIPGD